MRLLELGQRLFNPLRWSVVDRCLLVVAIMGPASAAVAIIAGLLAGWPFMVVAADDPGARRLILISVVQVVAWTALLGLLLWRRRRAGRGQLWVYVTTQQTAMILGTSVVFAGAFGTPGWVAYVGASIIGFMLFDLRAMLASAATYVTIVAAGVVSARLGQLPQLVGFVGPPPDTWVSAHALCALFSGLVLLLAGTLVTQWRQREARIEELARTDPLTGVANRRHFFERLEHERQRALRHGGALSYVLVDLDHFKRINDTHGHLVGDMVLVHAAHLLRDAVRSLDMVGRYGGEEFALLLPDTDAAGAAEVASRCLRKLADAVIAAGEVQVRVTASLGVATLVTDEPSREGLLRRADEALGEAKRAGRNRVVAA